MPDDPHEQPSPPHPWRIFVDTGGTFTDCLALAPDGAVRRAKVLSSGSLRAAIAAVESPSALVLTAPWLERPGFAVGATLACRGGRARVAAVEPIDHQTARATLDIPIPAISPGDTAELTTGEEAPILAARMVTGTPAGEPLPPTHLRLATTRGTNALLERRGAPTAFFVTEGFADLLLIGDQTRPDLFTLRVRRPRPLHDRVVEVRERLDASGGVITALDLDALRARARAVLDAGVRVAAVALMHSWREPAHERAVRDTLLALGFEHVSASSDLGSAIGFLPRAETAVVNAYLAPVIDRYLDRVQRPLQQTSRPGSGRPGAQSDLQSGLLVMTSAGGLVDRDGFAPKDSLLSGPAGGVLGATEAGRRAGFPRVITFDMGGTSTDCARAQGLPERVYQTRVGDARIIAPCVAVETVAAGGGSVCSVDRAVLRVGPESAGAEPGPACYGRGGPLTITDCNLLLGRLDPTHFAVPLDRPAAEARAQETLAHARGSIAGASAGALTLESLLTGFLAIADQRMAEAVRRITIRRGHDPAEHALVAFGGAGPQHACAIADALDIDHIVVPPDAGLLSAFGLSVATLERVADAQVLAPLEGELPTLAARLDELEARARAPWPDDAGRTVTTRTVELRFQGQDDILELDARDCASLAARFAERYREIFSYTPAETPLELVTARVTAMLQPAPDRAPGDGDPAMGEGPVGAGYRARGAPGPSADPPEARVFTDRWQAAPIHARHTLRPNDPITGPALITEAHSTTFLAPGWRAMLGGAGSLLLTRDARADAPRVAHRSEAVEVELAAGKLTAIAEEMGERLKRTAISTNVKQRRDFSCAILDADGRLVVNAPHVPVHLGSMGVCVRAVRDLLGPDLGHATILTNHPAFGGSHLPDVTVIEPVHDNHGRLLGYTAARAHHAEIGGIAPGSMAPDATRLADEGVVIPPTTLARAGPIDWGAVRALFMAGPHPSRDPETNCRDLAAALHAVRAGADGLRALAASLGPDRFDAIGGTIQARAESRVRAALARLPDGVYQHAEPVLGGGPIAVRITIAGDEASIDFTGSGPVHPRCLNATPAIVTSAVIYLLRLLIDENLPLNEGLLSPVSLVIPEGLLNPGFPADPAHCPAVAGGNVEISQLVVEAMLTALGLVAQSQGTMNNTVLGNESFGFYETLGGGAGAGPDFSGESSIHTHMTNTALTDPEIVEQRHPIRIESCVIRRGSGGAGAHPGGDGMIRRYRFLSPIWVGLLTGRASQPRGAQGGKPGGFGAAKLVFPGGREVVLAEITHRVPPGTLLEVATPGGGGFGETAGS
ncbi:MAG: hydantoinase B/oxoprolinase family protein [Phycisphaerales bacterium]|nr:hydantoinase B/oxoprolinase family protein [Phycisphaerales bacterium]